MFEKLLDFGNAYAKQSDWKDFALVKLCLGALGLVLGCCVAEKHKAPVLFVAGFTFVATWIPLMKKVLAVFRREADDDDYVL